MSLPALRLGIDLGGTKIAGIVLDADSRVVVERRVPAPRDGYVASVRGVAELVRALEAEAGASCSVGIGMPGSVKPRSRRVQNANSTWLNNQPFPSDVEEAIGRPARFANDANCFALSEAFDGAARGARSVFGVILGTGCGGGLVFGGTLIDGPNGIGGEWGHNPLPWMSAEEFPGPRCWCGRLGCLESWISGSGLAADHERRTGAKLTGEEIVASARAGDQAARDTLGRHCGRLARGLAHAINLYDPEVIVLGGGLSSLEHFYVDLPPLVARRVFADEPVIDIRRPRWGDASGVRGAARLWDAT
jgi:fructokinase